MYLITVYTLAKIAGSTVWSYASNVSLSLVSKLVIFHAFVVIC